MIIFDIIGNVFIKKHLKYYSIIDDFICKSGYG